jgi:patatin-like phospholipase/acyl hydrolase
MARAAASTPIPERRSAGAIAGRRQPLSWPSERPFRILSVDGGGIKGMFPASFLADLEETLCEGRSVGEHFDLIAGTSTGGIIALGLASGMRASEIKRIYEDNGEAIFPPVRGWFRRLRRGLRFVANLGRYTYEREPLAKALKAVFGDRLFGDTTRRLCVPSFEGRYGEVVVFKTPHHPDFKKDWKETIVDVALATSAAPSFFKTYKSGEQVYADGGVWANNPVMLGLVEALASYDVDRGNIEILSISCGDVDIPFSKGQILKGGLIHWREIIKSAMHLSSQNATGQAGLLIGRNNLVRVEPPECFARLDMDDFDAVSVAVDDAVAASVEKYGPELGRFFTDVRPHYRAVYGPRATTV